VCIYHQSSAPLRIFNISKTGFEEGIEGSLGFLSGDN
jgi:hypothetical protein